LYPAGEGAGYAGGILSAGVDGVKIAESLAKAMLDDFAYEDSGYEENTSENNANQTHNNDASSNVQ